MGNIKEQVTLKNHVQQKHCLGTVGNELMEEGL